MSLSENQLIINAQKGDMEAFEKLVYKYDRHVLSIAKSFRNNEDDAKDIYQEVFIRVYRGLKNFQFKSEFSTWIFRITTNVCISFNRSKKQHDSIDREIGNDEEGKTTFAEQLPGELRTDDKAVGSVLSNHINRALNQLSPQQKMAFTLKFYQDYKIKEIADIMHCNEGTIKRYLFTATNKMREKLKGLK
ncbi:MAG: RNA polymerase sigma factor [Bacteroidota bacterium]|jgi:RNA polymerase sigma-70 factor (ECF subfamily)